MHGANEFMFCCRWKCSHVKIYLKPGLYIKIRLFYMARVNVDAIRVPRILSKREQKRNPHIRFGSLAHCHSKLCEGRESNFARASIHFIPISRSVAHFSLAAAGVCNGNALRPFYIWIWERFGALQRFANIHLKCCARTNIRRRVSSCGNIHM